MRPDHQGREFHWYLKGYAAMKKNASKDYLVVIESPKHYLSGYNVSIVCNLRKYFLYDNPVYYFYLKFYVGAYDSSLEWPFSKSVRVTAIHSRDENWTRTRTFYECLGDFDKLQRPDGNSYRSLAFLNSWSLNDLDMPGFVENGSLHLSFEVV
ncbi:unnamed protein product [Ixodes persulcatus]